MSNPAAPSPPMSRAPAYVHSVAFVGLLILIAAIALKAVQPPPPQIAEFAPQSEQVQQGTLGKGTGPGFGEGDCDAAAPECFGESGASNRQLPSKRTIDVTRVRRCIGNPPRQIEDPQSPPCVAYWEGDNGGETYRGVTRDEIRIGTLGAGFENPNILLKFFNSRFEFYGRKIVVVDQQGCPDTYYADTPTQRAFAQCLDEEKHVFGAISEHFNAFGAQQWAFKDEMSRRKLINVASLPWLLKEDMAAHAPYMWQYSMAADDLMKAFGEWGCKRLSGQPPIHAGGTEAAKPRRVFGIILHTSRADDPLTTEPLRKELAKCGESNIKEVVYYIADEADGDLNRDPSKDSNTIAQMRLAGVTSIFCFCITWQMQFLSTAASSQSYQPEWYFSSYGYMDGNWGLSKFGSNEQQLSHALGLTTQPRQVAIANNMFHRAMKEANPDHQPYATAQAFYTLYNEALYRALLLMASGIQMAGPNLTPHSFARGLQTAVFPNPDHPNNAGKVGFLDGDYAMTNDIGEWWWSAGARSPYRDRAGSICYVDGGVRRKLGGFPTRSNIAETPFFQVPCDSGA